MKISAITLLSLLAGAISSPTAGDDEAHRELSSKSGKKGMSRNKMATVSVTNSMQLQPLSPFFYMSHRCNGGSGRIFEVGQAAPANGLEALAENGSPDGLISYYEGMSDVCYAGSACGLTAPGATCEIPIPMGSCDCVSVASMLVVTNDAFVAINRRRPEDIMDSPYPAWDAGTEANDELCSSIPACPDGNNNNDNAGAEGFVHTSFGILGQNEIAANYTWLNPAILASAHVGFPGCLVC